VGVGGGSGGGGGGGERMQPSLGKRAAIARGDSICVGSRPIVRGGGPIPPFWASVSGEGGRTLHMGKKYDRLRARGGGCITEVEQEQVAFTSQESAMSWERRRALMHC